MCHCRGVEYKFFTLILAKLSYSTMNEAFLHFLWKNGLFQTPLTECRTGEPIEVVNPGQHNHDQGPDFFNARLRIGDTTWAGNVEIHLRASDWLRHNHQSDERYNNIILHVVGVNDVQINNQAGEPIPTAELKCPAPLLERYLFLMQTDKWLPCQSYISKIDSFVMTQWFESLAIERIERKIEPISVIMQQTHNDWQESFYHAVAQSFGFRTNAQPFLMLARSLPLNVIAKHKNSLLQVEALLFGQSGLLPVEPVDEYVGLLQREYGHLRLKYSLTPIQTQVWKFARMRPGNLPTVRIAQFAMLVYRSSALMSKLMDCADLEAVYKLFAVGVSDYWLTHYVFGKESARRNKHLGAEAINLLTINAFVPFMFYYGKTVSNADITDRAIQWLEQVPAESNHIIAQWKKFGVEPHCALESQALLQLADAYCERRRCLSCRVGRQVMTIR